MRFKGNMTSDEADALAGRAKSVSAQHYVLHDLKSFADKVCEGLGQLRSKHSVKLFTVL